MLVKKLRVEGEETARRATEEGDEQAKRARIAAGEPMRRALDRQPRCGSPAADQFQPKLTKVAKDDSVAYRSASRPNARSMGQSSLRPGSGQCTWDRLGGTGSLLPSRSSWPARRSRPRKQRTRTRCRLVRPVGLARTPCELAGRDWLPLILCALPSAELLGRGPLHV